MRDPLKAVTDGDGLDIGDEGEPSLTWGQMIGQSWTDSQASLLIFAALVAVFAWQMYARFFLDFEPIVLGGLSAAAVAEGRWWTIASSMFLHGGILHILLNSSALLGLGLVLGRRLGGGPRGFLTFLGLYLVFGLVGGLAYLLINPAGIIPMVGASGAIFGIWGATARLDPETGALLPVWSKQTRGEIFRAVVMNLVLVGPLVALQLVSDGLPFGVAWEAHLGGFVAGLILIGLVPQSRAAVSFA